ncbi:hypothetical protein [Paenibacillus sp. IHB B 3415]|nr:hypothetical protein [Paenibacillus sp. IHB B 3415]
MDKLKDSDIRLLLKRKFTSFAEFTAVQRPYHRLGFVLLDCS